MEENLVTGQEAGQPQNLTAGEVPGQTTQDAGNSVDVQAALEEVRQQMAQLQSVVAQQVEEAKRYAQSLTDKSANRLQARLAEIERTVALQKQLGMEVNDEQVLAMKQAALVQAFQESGMPPQQAHAAAAQQAQQAQQGAQPNTVQPPGQPQPEGRDVGLDPVGQTMLQIMENEGVTIEDNDPEVEIIKPDASPAEAIRSLLQAIEAKKARLAGKANVRLPAGGGNGAPPPQFTEETPASEMFAAASKRGD